MTTITRTFATRRLLMVALAGTVSLAACGSSSAGGAGDTATSAKAVATSVGSTAGSSAEGSTSAASASGTTAASAATTSQTTAKSSGSSGSADAGALADGMVGAFNAVAKGDCGKARSISDDMDVNPSVGNATAQLDGFGKALAKLASSGPSDLRADFAIMSTAFSGLARAYDELGLGGDPSKLSSVMTDPAKAAELAKLGEQMNSADVKAASDHISKWIEDKCPGLGSS